MHHTDVILITLFKLGMAFCFFALAILQSIPHCPAWIMQIFFTASTPFSGMNFLGVVKCAQLVCLKSYNVYI